MGNQLKAIAVCLLIFGPMPTQANDLEVIDGGGSGSYLSPSRASRMTQREAEPVPAGVDASFSVPNLSRHATSQEEIIDGLTSGQARQVDRENPKPSQPDAPCDGQKHPPAGRNDCQGRLPQPPPVPPEASVTNNLIVVIQLIPGQSEERKKVPVPNCPMVEIRNIEFDYDSAEIRQEDYPYLAGLGKALIDPRLASEAVVINGHTDSDGSEDYNLKLSFRRALAVRAHLVEWYHIDMKRLFVRGFGKSWPRAYNNSPEGKQANRRVEIAIWNCEQNKN
ncbi:MAG: OmpA family protein [Magnetococcales bacterium]|nr:OmpA family protein [Magnetococcales bacterium]